MIRINWTHLNLAIERHNFRWLVQRKKIKI